MDFSRRQLRRGQASTPPIGISSFSIAATNFASSPPLANVAACLALAAAWLADFHGESSWVGAGGLRAPTSTPWPRTRDDGIFYSSFHSSHTILFSRY